ncbi:hypothetical protein F5887DRAFT_888954, partial [Amanita rubescens]
LLYKELSYAMNVSDIGQLEQCLLLWIPLFKATGKHKYAAAMEKHLIETHFDYPAPLCQAIRYNSLVNPTSKAGKFRGVDWVVEAMNCEIKVKHGGQGSNRSAEHMIAESALIGTFQAINDSIEHNLHLYSTSAHGAPDMRRTIGELRRSFLHSSPRHFTPSRKSLYCVLDMLNKGLELLHNKYRHGGDADGADKDENDMLQPECDEYNRRWRILL